MIETERLILRKIDPDRDFEAWAKAMADEQTVQFLGTKPMSRANAWRSMAMVMGHWAIRGYGFFSVELKETGEWVGRIGPWQPEGWFGPEVGWTLSPDHLKKGYALEAARASMSYSFEALGWSRIIHVIMVGNEPSIALAEKLGSRLLSTHRGIPGLTDEDVLVYGQSRPD